MNAVIKKNIWLSCKNAPNKRLKNFKKKSIHYKRKCDKSLLKIRDSQASSENRRNIRMKLSERSGQLNKY